MDKYRLLEIDISDRTTQRETEAIGSLEKDLDLAYV